MCDSDTHPAGGADDTTCRVVLQGPELTSVLQAFAPLRTSLLDSLLMFGEDGLLIHSTILGEQVFMQLGGSSFSKYEWRGPAAAFLAIVDQRHSLLGAFRAIQGHDVTRVEFVISGTQPFRTLVRRVWVSDPDGDPREPLEMRLMKREITSFSVMLPQGRPDVQLRLTKHQLAKMVAVAAEDAPLATFELSANKKFAFFSPNACITFAAVENSGPADAIDQAHVLSQALRGHKHAAAAKTVYGDNTHCTFTATLDTANMRAVLRRLQVGGATLKFFLQTETPSVCVTDTGPSRVSAIFLLKPLDSPPSAVAVAQDDSGGAAACGALQGTCGAEAPARAKGKPRSKRSATREAGARADGADFLAHAEQADASIAMDTSGPAPKKTAARTGPSAPETPPAKVAKMKGSGESGEGCAHPSPILKTYFVNPPRIVPVCGMANHFGTTCKAARPAEGPSQ
ncbi:DNA polymerase processivity factor [Leporid alphaherpesvirus 4]|uniref:DNA polymerase processivity factor n=1 Tax=Leporid alphaherpesvirus 4 TaxID=481315 RepID=J9QWM1_9ALPH|nr:DNA polymerase processivity factor [Leporid alphaherpesvirus 4]AFR32484.1 DNA polymerase processivity factor [Leporid alphaherpesvirus 4]